MSNSSSQIIHVIDKSGAEQIRVSLSVFRGIRFADLRIFFRTVDGEYKPTKKGLTLNPSLLPELEEALKKLRKELRQKNKS